MARGFLLSVVCLLPFFTAKAQAPLNILLAANTPLAPISLNENQNRLELFQNFSQPVQLRNWEANEDADTWKNWALIENYTFGKDRGSIPMIVDLQSLHPYFRDKVMELIRVCKAKGIELAIVESYRTRTKQNEYKSMGRRYTRAAAGSSKHQYGLAVDVVPVIDSVIQWNNIALWRKIGVQGEKLGLRWGGRWRRPFDPAHFEWTGGTATYHLAQGTFPTVPKSAHYPCIDDDLKELQHHWKSWEIEQSALSLAQPKQSRPAKQLSGGGGK